MAQIQGSRRLKPQALEPARMRSTRRATSYDVATLAGVSQSAVSRAFNSNASISKALRKKVLTASKELNFRPNAVARSLTTSRSGVIAFFLPRIGNPIYPVVLEAFSHQLRAQNFQILLMPLVKNADEALAWLIQYQVEGLVITAASPLALSKEITKKCLKARIPVVLFNRYFAGVRAASVCCENRLGGGLAAETLFATGHRRFAFVGGPEPTSADIDRRAGFESRLQELGAAAPLIQSTAFSYAGGHAAGLRLFAGRSRPNAIFCVTDVIALGVLDAARHDHDLRVPADLSIIGFDDTPMSAWVGNGLTTVRLPVGEMVNQAVSLLMREIEHHQPKPEALRVAGELVIRNTTRPA